VRVVESIDEPGPASEGRGSSQSALEILRDWEWLTALPEPYLERLAELCGRRSFGTDEVIGIEGHPASRLYFIRQGGAVVEAYSSDGARHVADWRGRGSVVGWASLFPPYRFPYDVRATEPTDTLFLYGAAIREIVKSDAQFEAAWMKAVASAIFSTCVSKMTVGATSGDRP